MKAAPTGMPTVSAEDVSDAERISRQQKAHLNGAIGSSRPPAQVKEAGRDVLLGARVVQRSSAAE